tara:strand:+ start:347 stop:484 length:138 start_codon:yes stop_codon:yes gene_type:complete
MAKKSEKKETKKAEPVKEEPKVCTCRTEKGFRKNPPCGIGEGCLA